MTHASRDTSTGLKFEEYVTIKSEGICLTKNNLYKYLKDNNIDWTSILSRKLLPDEAYYNPNTKEFSIYEKNISKQKVLPTKNLKLVALKFGNIKNWICNWC